MIGGTVAAVPVHPTYQVWDIENQYLGHVECPEGRNDVHFFNQHGQALGQALSINAVFRFYDSTFINLHSWAEDHYFIASTCDPSELKEKLDFWLGASCFTDNERKAGREWLKRQRPLKRLGDFLQRIALRRLDHKTTVAKIEASVHVQPTPTYVG